MCQVHILDVSNIMLQSDSVIGNSQQHENFILIEITISLDLDL